MRAILYSALLTAAHLACACGTPTAVQTSEEPTTSPAAVDARVIRNTKVYVGGDGMRVTVVRFMPPDDSDALIEISGTDSELDELVVPHEYVDDHFETKIHGRTYWTMRKTKDDGRWSIWIGGRERKVDYDEAASDAADGEELRKRHAQQVAAGITNELQRFNREARIEEGDELFAKEHARIEETCGFAIPGAIAWDTVDDDLMLKVSIYGFCSHPASALRTICERDSSYRDLLAARVKSVQCRFGDEVSLDLGDDGALTWTVESDASNLDNRATQALTRAVTDNPTVLATGRGHYLLVDPLSLYQSVKDAKLYFGDDKVVYEQRPPPQQHGFYHGSFWSPREDHESSIVLADGAWKLSCGDRDHALTEVTGAKRTKLLAAVDKKPASWLYEPYLLARDDMGTYYYVDRLRDGGKGFRVFRGPKGGLKLTHLVNIVEDAEGEIFATKVGSLRLVVESKDDQAAWWLEGDDKTDLVTVPIRLSQKLIYSQLGVYDGQDLGTPCDQY